MARARGFGFLTNITSKVFNIHLQVWMMVSCLQCCTHATRTRVSKHGMEPVKCRPNHGIGEGKFPLCVAVITRCHITNNFIVIENFIEVSVWIFLSAYNKFVCLILFIKDPLVVSRVCVLHCQRWQVKKTFNEQWIIGKIHPFGDRVFKNKD